MAVDPQLLRSVMRRWATGVTLVSAHDGPSSHGMTVSSFTSVSLDPPLVLISIENGSRTHGTILSSGRFAVAILAEDQRALADRFAGAMPDTADRFQGIPSETSPSGERIPVGALAALECRVVDAHTVGNHTLFIGEVQAAQSLRDSRPLLYYEGDYRHLAG